MKMLFKHISFFTIISVATLTMNVGNLVASEYDPTYKDESIQNIYRVVSTNGALTLDNRAIETGANEWEIKVTKVSLEGATATELEDQWKMLIAQKESEIKAKLVSDYGQDVVADASADLETVMKQIRDNADVLVLTQKNENQEPALQWLITQLLTSIGRENVSFYLEGQYKKSFDVFRYHWDDTSMEVMGEDMLMMRGAKEVIIINISYVHS